MIASFALALEVRRWFESGPRLSLSVMGDALFFPQTDGNPRLALTVINRGTTSTTLSNMVLFGYTSRWQKWRKKPFFTAIVPQPDIPFELGANKFWLASLTYDEETIGMRRKGQRIQG